MSAIRTTAPPDPAHGNPARRDAGHGDEPRRDAGHGDDARRDADHGDDARRDAGHGDEPRRDAAHRDAGRARVDAGAEGAAPAGLSPAALLVLLGAVFVGTLDFFVVNVGLPVMRADLGAGPGTVTAWVAAYGAGFGAFLLLGARLGDRIGRRRAFVAGLAAFTVASAGCGVAPDATSLIALRVAQGLAIALAMPQVLATITALTEGAARGKAVAAYGLTAGAAAISGQLVGGALIDLDLAGLGWRWCFLVNVPFGIAAVALALRVLPETRARRPPRVDGLSALLLTGGLTAIVIPLSIGRDHDWPLWCLLALVAGVDALIAFTLRQRRLARRGDDPLVDLALLREHGFGRGSLVVFVLQAGIASSFLVLAVTLQGGYGLDPLAAGLVFTILAVGYVASSVVSDGLLRKLGPKLLVVGAAISVLGEAWLALEAHGVAAGASIAPLVPGLLLAGVGMGLQFSPSVAVALTGVRPQRAGEAAGVLSTTQQVGGAIGVALVGTVFADALAAGGPAHAFAVGSWVLAALATAVGLLAAAGGRDRTVGG